MRLDHTFTVPAPVDEAWKTLLDVPRVAPCMPGATLTEFDGESFSGTVRVKLGPVSLTYRGTGRFADVDEAARRVVIEASGKESRGSGTATATVTAVLVEGAGATRVDVGTDLTITGRPAQFGRGMISDVGDRLLGQFANSLEQLLHGSAAADATAGATPEESAKTAIPEQPTAQEPTMGTASQSATTQASTAAASAQTPSAGGAGERESAAEPIDLIEITGAREKLRHYRPYVVGAGVGMLIGGLLTWLLTRRGRNR